MLDSMRTSRPRPARRGASARASARIELIEPRILFATFTVTNTADAGAGSFRQAILDANAAPNPADDVDYIFFNIPGAGVHTITPLSQLPTVTDIVTIDATGDDLVTPTVELNGSSAGAGANGLVLASTDPVLASFVAGLIINRFSGNGILITGDSNGVGLSYIGTNAAGTAAGAGNGGHGILIQSSGNFASDNVIAFNGGDGVAVVGATAAGNDVGINNIFQNTGEGIDLGNDGVTPNDAGDADAGPNDLQNFPVLTYADNPGGGVLITGTVNSTANTDLDIAIYSNPTQEREGRVFIEHFQVRTDGSGNASFSRPLPTASRTDWYTATATELFVVSTNDIFAINTSEFSVPVGGTVTPTPVIDATYVRGSTWLLPDAQPTTFMELLEARGLGDDTLGYRVNPAAVEILPWINMNQVIFHYTGDLTAAPAAANFLLDGSRSDYTGTTSLIDARTVLLQLPGPLGGNPATAATNGDRIRVAVTGGATGGGTYEVRFNFVQGDVNRSGSVLANDYSEVKARFFQNTTQPAYSPFHDVDGSGSVLANDYSAVKARFFHNLPPAAIASPAGITEDLFSSSSIL